MEATVVVDLPVYENDGGRSSIIFGHGPGSYQFVDYESLPSRKFGEAFAVYNDYVNTYEPVPTAIALQFLGHISAEFGNPDYVSTIDPADW